MTENFVSFLFFSRRFPPPSTGNRLNKIADLYFPSVDDSNFSLSTFVGLILFTEATKIDKNPKTELHLCPAMASSSFDSDTRWKNTALLVIDMQNDFILPDGLMRVDGGQAIVPNVIKAVEVARRRGILVIWVVREHDSLGRDVELFRQHLYSSEKAGPTSKGSLGAELVDGLVIKEGDYKVVKTRFSAFFATHLNSFLKTAGINSLVVVGVQTPNCIRQTVFDAVALDYKYVAVIVDGMAAATPDIHFANIFDMKNIGVATPTLQEWGESDA